MKHNIRFLVMDVDGTLTDGKIYMGQQGEVFKAFDIKDGAGIKDLLPQAHIIPVVITARDSNIVRNRCDELGIHFLVQGIRNKMEELRAFLGRQSEEDGAGYTLKNVAYIGDDLLDLQCMIPIREAGGLVGCPADAAKEVIAAADFISTRKGGDGAVREFIEWMNE